MKKKSSLANKFVAGLGLFLYMAGYGIFGLFTIVAIVAAVRHEFEASMLGLPTVGAVMFLIGWGLIRASGRTLKWANDIIVYILPSWI